MSADDNDSRHVTAARAMLASITERLAKHILANQRLVADNDQLRADIATVTAERDAARVDETRLSRLLHRSRCTVTKLVAERDGACEGKGNLWVQLEAERAAHAETRKALELETAALKVATNACKQWLLESDSTRAELAKAEAR